LPIREAKGCDGGRIGVNRLERGEARQGADELITLA